MQNPTVIVVILWLLFAASHMLPSSRAIRSRLISRLGEKRFLGAYSLTSFVFFMPLVYYYMTHRHAGPLLWTPPASEAAEIFLTLLNVAGCVLLVAGVMTPSPASITGAPRDNPTGAQQITRHPVFMGIGLWALAHVALNGYASDVAFFGGFVVFALAGSWHQDRRKLAGGDARFERFHAATPFVPFIGRGTLRGLMELPPLAVIIGVAVALAARYLHPSSGG